MLYAVEFIEKRTYVHDFTVEADNEAEANSIASKLAGSSDFLCDIAGNGSYFETELDVGLVWKPAESERYFRIYDNEIEEYTKE